MKNTYTLDRECPEMLLAQNCAKAFAENSAENGLMGNSSTWKGAAFIVIAAALMLLCLFV